LGFGRDLVVVVVGFGVRVGLGRDLVAVLGPLRDLAGRGRHGRSVSGLLRRLGLLGVGGSASDVAGGVRRVGRLRSLLVLRLFGHRPLTLSDPAWPRKCRVGANSPSLWPTIASEMKTGTCFLPSWTAIV